MLRQILCLCAVAVAASNAEDSLTVTINQGDVKGYKKTGYNVYEFHGIPYATAPTGNDRYKAPLDPPSWEGTLEATNASIVCPQNDRVIKTVSSVQAHEDCLVASIYVPSTNRSDYSVLVYVHGGAFQNGYAERYTARYVADNNDVIFLLFNYRLGVHGFLCLGTESAPGNAGMKDQVKLLQWVQDNIAAFGGNADDVTIYGSSAGGRAVDLLMVSGSADGLFQRMIADSGASLGAGTVQVDPVQNAKTFAKMLNFTNADDMDALEQFYLNASYDTLLSIDTTTLNNFLFTPCVEADIGQDMFLSKSPYQILSDGDYTQVPLLYGFTQMEGSFRLLVFQDWKDKMNANLTDYLPSDLEFDCDETRDNVTQMVKDYYFGDNVINNTNIMLFINYFTDTMYVYPMIRGVQLHLAAGHKEVYLSEYSFTSEESSVVPYINKRGAFHAIQFQATLDYKNETDITTEFKNMKKIMREIYFSNFINDNEPVSSGSSLPEWPATTSENIYIMSINQTLELGTLKHRAQFWADIYDKYYTEPIPPSSCSDS